jgi:serine/threonine-protein kinase
MAFLNRGIARGQSGNYDGAIADFDKALELGSRESSTHFNRGYAKYLKGDSGGAIPDYQKAIEIDPKNADAHNSLAWIMATAPDAKLRNGRMAIEHALKAVELTERKRPGFLETLAAAYAEGRNFPAAIKWQMQALASPEYAGTDGEQARERLKLYQQRRPFRDQ